MNSEHKVVPFDSLASWSDSIRSAGSSIVHCHGVFDLLHPGHLRHLSAAKRLGDILVVTITADQFVGKGPGRPAFSHDLRAESLASLESVDVVSIVSDASAIPAIQALRPDFFVKGAEYADEEGDPTGKIRQERLVVEQCGGQVTFTNDIVFSSSQLINTFLPQHGPGVQTWLHTLRDRFGSEEILSWIDKLSTVEVVTIGEAILDVYTECDTLGKASKEPVLCLNRRASVTHGGGAIAIASHCAGLGAKVTLITGVNMKVDGSNSIIESLTTRGIRAKLVDISPRPTIRKERVIDASTRARVIEIYEMDDSPIDGAIENELVEVIEEICSATPMTLVADYGHGLLSDKATEAIVNCSTFLAVNAQANAGNHGFNSVQKYQHVSFVSLNGQEARLEARRRHLEFDTYLPGLRERLTAEGVLVTQGGGGLDLYLADGHVDRSPALAPFVLDRVGAGDAVLAITSMLFHLGAPPPIIGFLGNLAGAWAVTFLGNEQVLSAGLLKRQVLAVLK